MSSAMISSRLSNVGEDVLVHCASFLSAGDLARCSAASRYFHGTLGHDILWRNRTTNDLGITSLSVTPPGVHSSLPTNFRQLYLLWRKGFFGYPLDLVKRAYLFWTGFEKWATENAPDVLTTLCEPASEEYIRSFDTETQLRLPAGLRLLYRFHDGQRIPFSENPTRRTLHSIGWGMFGGTAFYDRLESMQFLPLSELQEASHKLAVIPSTAPQLPLGENFYHHHRGHTRRTEDFSAIAFSTNVNKSYISKVYYVSSDGGAGKPGGDVFTNTEHFEDVIPCHPASIHGGKHNSGLFAWLEEYLRRLREGIYAFQPIDLTQPELQLRPPSAGRDSNPHMISHFPLKPLYDRESGANIGATTCVTRGVEITACPAFIPEMSNPWRNEFHWSYSIRMRLLRDSSDRPQALLACQLTHRHWTISQYSAIDMLNGRPDRTEEVHGEAVIGLYPLLSIDYSQPSAQVTDAANRSWPFAYQSCSNASSFPGTFSGHLDFVPGTKDSPAGPSFEVFLEPFTTSVPEFIY